MQCLQPSRLARRTNVHCALPVTVDAAHQLCGLLASGRQQLEDNGGPAGVAEHSGLM